jgi:hypothetical protein
MGKKSVRSEGAVGNWQREGKPPEILLKYWARKMKNRVFLLSDRTTFQ